MSGHCSSMSGPVTSQIGTVLWAQFPYNFSTWEDSGTVSNTLSTLIYELLSIWGFCIKIYIVTIVAAKKQRDSEPKGLTDGVAWASKKGP